MHTHGVYENILFQKSWKNYYFCQSSEQESLPFKLSCGSLRTSLVLRSWHSREVADLSSRRIRGVVVVWGAVAAASIPFSRTHRSKGRGQSTHSLGLFLDVYANVSDGSEVCTLVKPSSSFKVFWWQHQKAPADFVQEEAWEVWREGEQLAAVRDLWTWTLCWIKVQIYIVELANCQLIVIQETADLTNRNTTRLSQPGRVSNFVCESSSICCHRLTVSLFESMVCIVLVDLP